MKRFTLYWRSLNPEQKDAFAKTAGTTAAYINKVINGKGKLYFGASICVSIEQQTEGRHMRQELRPHDWHRIWPELIDKEAA